MGTGFVRNPHDKVAVGDVVEVEVLNVDAARGRISLALIEVAPREDSARTRFCATLHAMSLLRLPRQMNDVQALLRSLDWHATEREVAQETASRLVIVGPVNSGKSTLFQRLHGRKLSATSAVPGTTTGVVEHPLGPFLLVDTPGFGEVWGVDRASVAQQAVAQANLVLLLPAQSPVCARRTSTSTRSCWV